MYRFDPEDGVSGGLVIWAVFIIVFWVLGVPALLAILLSAFAGAAVTFIQIYWWAEKDEEAVEKREEESPIRPIRLLIERLPFLSGSGLGRTPTRRLTQDPTTGETQQLGKEPGSRASSPIRSRRPKSSFSDAVKRRKDESGG